MNAEIFFKRRDSIRDKLQDDVEAYPSFSCSGGGGKGVSTTTHRGSGDSVGRRPGTVAGASRYLWFIDAKKPKKIIIMILKKKKPKKIIIMILIFGCVY